MKHDCSRAQALAGAIALDEAVETDLDAYRRHVAVCADCANDLGGEREFQRLASVVRQARDDERWEPQVALSRGSRNVAMATALRFGLAAAAGALLTVGAFATLGGVRPNAGSARLQALRDNAVAALRTVPSGPFAAQRAESLALLPVRSSTTISVRVDANGRPVSCTIVRQGTSPTRDARLCASAMHRRY